MVSKIFEKLVNDRIVDHLEKCGLFSDFRYGFRSFRSTSDRQAIVPDRIAGLLIGIRLLELWHLIYPRHVTGCGILVFFTNSYRNGISCHVFGRILSFLSNTLLQLVLEGKYLQKYPVNAEDSRSCSFPTIH